MEEKVINSFIAALNEHNSCGAVIVVSDRVLLHVIQDTAMRQKIIDNTATKQEILVLLHKYKDLRTNLNQFLVGLDYDIGILLQLLQKS